jgi:hypothetical protein
MDSEVDPRLTTRHFDLLIACAIAWQMKDYAVKAEKEGYVQPPYQPTEMESGNISGVGSSIIATPTGGKITTNAEYQQEPIME